MAVSIHATLAGGDAAEENDRVQKKVVSIHATLAGGDAMSKATIGALTVFLSTPPSRVATVVPPGADNAVLVSIHATLAGGDRHSLTDLC